MAVSKGKSVESILKMNYWDLQKYTDQELRDLVSRGVSAANKRIRRYVQQQGELPQPIQAAHGFDKKLSYENAAFTLKGKTTREDVLGEFARIKQYMGAETSSLRGERKTQKRAVKELKAKGNVDISESNYDKIWKAYERLKDMHPEIAEKNYKYIALEKIKEYHESNRRRGYKQIADAISAEWDKIYEQQQQILSQYFSDVGVSNLMD